MADNISKFLDNVVGLPTLVALIDKRFVAKVDGKDLSTNDFTKAYKDKLDGIEIATVEETREYLKLSSSDTPSTGGSNQGTVDNTAIIEYINNALGTKLDKSEFNRDKLIELIGVFEGATDDSDGTVGLVPV